MIHIEVVLSDTGQITVNTKNVKLTQKELLYDVLLEACRVVRDYNAKLQAEKQLVVAREVPKLPDNLLPDGSSLRLIK